MNNDELEIEARIAKGKYERECGIMNDSKKIEMIWKWIATTYRSCDCRDEIEAICRVSERDRRHAADALAKGEKR